jgi:small neutral amino acid transporter SnatA (MarC family)
MNTNWDLISNFVIALLAIVNPVEKIPLWVEASKGGTMRFQWRLAGLIILSSAIILNDLHLWAMSTSDKALKASHDKVRKTVK